MTEKAIKRLKVLEKMYVCEEEKEYYKQLKSEESRLGEDKVKMARIQYRGKGLYIDEILGGDK
ncbi:MAG: hypothetical protein Q4B60_06125 [Erysipelotrichaceae bacterium]|nr:hypothetical protein [Erysipelotrichaceae bacterium]